MTAAVLDFPLKEEVTPVPQFYYIQDTRTYTGNSAVWWRVGGNGYTTNLAEAWRVTGDWKGRDTDLLWPVEEIDARATRQFDAQNFRDIGRSE
jgi:hypothetical protein